VPGGQGDKEIVKAKEFKQTKAIACSGFCFYKSLKVFLESFGR
jgi:hypothetical protein